MNSTDAIFGTHRVKNWNEDPTPFIWTKTAEEILDSLARFCRRISGAGH
ncbi:hypothetical protein ACWD4L_42655 [Streptomyces sp. NPDC002596]